MIQLPTDILKSLLEKYGEEEQLLQAMGECGELIAVTQNYLRAIKYGHRIETIEEVIEEAVDVYFMIQQIRQIDPVFFDRLCRFKAQKVLQKFDNEPSGRK